LPLDPGGEYDLGAMNRRFLAIDWTLDHPEIRRDGFFDRTSFSSHDAVFVDPLALARHWTEAIAPGGDGVRRTDPQQDRGFGRTLARWMAKRRDESEDLLRRGGGLLVCRLHPRGEPVEIVSPGAPPDQIDRYSWLPTVSLVDRHHQFVFPSNGRFVARYGRDIHIEQTGNPFEDYLREFEGYLQYSAVYQDLLSTPLERFATVLARNRVGDAVALEIPFDEGRLVLLPSTERISPSREADALSESVRRSSMRPVFASVPDWLPSYPLPGEEEIADELAGLVERRDTLSAKVDEVTKRLEEKTRHKRLLFAKGRQLFDRAVADAFRQLGFVVEEEQDVLRIQSEEGNALVAAEASEDAKVGAAAYHRLHRDIDRAITDGEDPLKGILVLSGSRELDPKRRPTQFLPEVLRGARGHGYCILTSYQLFKLLQTALTEKSKKGLVSLRRHVLETDGEIRETRDAGDA
jgi:hypothetical protein